MFMDKSLMSVRLTSGFCCNFLCHRKMEIFELSQNLRQFKLRLIVEVEKKGIRIDMDTESQRLWTTKKEMHKLHLFYRWSHLGNSTFKIS